jgi:phosphomethylpyrimidine synthase
MQFSSLAVVTALCSSSAAFAFAPSTRSSASALRVANPINVDELVTKEANIKSTSRTKPTLDPFNPEFERIQSVPYNDAFPNSTKEYKTVTHEETGHTLMVPFRRVHLEDPDMKYLDLYDTSGPRDVNPHEGLPKVSVYCLSHEDCIISIWQITSTQITSTYTQTP